MAKDSSSLYVVSIVAVVAVVGLVTLFLDGGAGVPAVDAGDFVGQAISDGDDGARGPRLLLREKDTEFKPAFVSREDSRARQVKAQYLKTR